MNVIVAVDQNWAIGRDGDQLAYLSEDLKRFKNLTLGHPVILGRKTLSTFPGGRPLKGRRNLILSRNPDFAPEGSEVFGSLEAVLRAAPEDTFVIGGASVYHALLDRCDRLHHQAGPELPRRRLLVSKPGSAPGVAPGRGGPGAGGTGHQIPLCHLSKTISKQPLPREAAFHLRQFKIGTPRRRRRQER